MESNIPTGPFEAPSATEGLPLKRLAQRGVRSIRDALTQNVYLKVLSFALAVVLWAMVAEDQDFEESTVVYLDVKRPQDLIVLTPPPSTISLRVMGPRSKLKALRNSRLELPIDLTDAKPGEMVVSFVGQRIRNLPGGVEVTAYSPASLKIELDERLTRTLPVRVLTDGEPSPGHRITGTEVVPLQVTIEGPREELKRLREVRTESIKLTDLKTSHEAEFPLVLGNPNVHVVGGKETVLVRLKIEPVIEQRQFDRIAIEVPETMGRHLLQPNEANLVLEGPKEVLDIIHASDVRIFLQEGTIPLAELQETHILRYPPPANSKGLPRLLVSWPKDDVVGLKKMTPATFHFRVLKNGEGASLPLEKHPKRVRPGVGR